MPLAYILISAGVRLYIYMTPSKPPDCIDICVNIRPSYFVLAGLEIPIFPLVVVYAWLHHQVISDYILETNQTISFVDEFFNFFIVCPVFYYLLGFITKKLILWLKNYKKAKK